MIALAVDAILVLVPLEALGLVLWRARTGRGIAPRRLLGNLAAGFCLTAALRCALAGSPPRLSVQAGIAVLLLAAGIAHLIDLVGRWRT